MYAIKTENIIKQYKNGVQALSGLSLSVKAGEIFSLLGENGAGGLGYGCSGNVEKLSLSLA